MRANQAGYDCAIQPETGSARAAMAQYGGSRLDIMAIREIRAWTPTTRLPRVPHYVAGVVNLRGTVLPVIDLAARLGWPETQATHRHAIIVTQIGGQARGLRCALSRSRGRVPAHRGASGL